MEYTLEELDKETAEKLTEELKAVLEKYNCEMGTTAVINIWHRKPKEEPTVSPIQLDEKPDTETEKSG